jgi:F0F1-type ATP synthase membrane subunit b/b'
VRTRGNQRTAEIVQRAEAEIAALTADDDAGKARIIAQAQQEVRTMSEVATSRTNALTREVLDLDENTATIDTTEWLQRHGLE